MAEPKPEGAKKRKRTGKEREERKKAAILAAQNAQATEDADEVVEAPATDEAVKGSEAAKVSTPTPVDFEALVKRIPPALKKLHPVFKQAKKAETMRLIKKIRFLKTKQPDEVGELEAQLNLLSAIQLHALAANHLRQKLKKHHRLKHSELPQSFLDALPSNPTVASSSSSATPEVITKVENRLCSSKQVADAIKTVVPWVLSEPGATLSVSKGKAVVKAKGGKRPAADSDSDSDEDGGDDDEVPLGHVEGLDSDDEAVLEDKAADEAGWESGSVGGDDDGEGGWDSDAAARLAPASSDEEDDSDAVPEPPKKKAKAAAAPAPEPKKKDKKGKADGSSSMFLPTLATGFTAGDGDSDPDMDYDEDGIIGSKKAVRKNRRGQRARQAIWEKKYGKSAKHVVRAREEAEKKVRGPQGQRRDQGWGQRSGPEPDAEAPKSKPDTRAAGPSGKPSRAASGAQAQSKDEGKALHPSWEAARLRRQREMGAGTAPKATKIVFD